MNLVNFRTRDRRRRNRVGQLGHAGAFDERADAGGDRRNQRDRRSCREGFSHQRRGIHFGQGRLLRRRGPDHAAGHGQGIRARRQSRRRGGGDAVLLRPLAPALADLSEAGNLGQAVRRGDQRRLHGRRLRAGARLPLPHRRRQRQGARRPAGNQGRPVSRRRRHAAHRAADADAGRPADVVQGRPDPPRRGQEDGPRPRRRSGGRDRPARQGLGEGQSRRQGALGRSEVQAAVGQGVLADGDDDLACRQRDLSPRNLRQLSRRQGDPRQRLRGSATADGSRARRREPLFREDIALEGSRGDDPLAVPVEGRAREGRAPARRRSRVEPAQDRRARRRFYGRGGSVCFGERRARGRADRSRPGIGRQGQGAFGKADLEPDRQGPRQERRPRGAARPHPRERRLFRV